MPTNSHTSTGPLVLVRIAGGLGNVLFQYAAGLQAASAAPATAVVAYGREQSIRQLEAALGVALPRADRAADLRIPLVLDRERCGMPVRVTVELLARAARRLGASRVLQQRPENALDRPMPVPRPSATRPLTLDGYFQHPDWTTHTYEQVAASVGLRLGGPARSDQTAIHLRRGDYVTLGHCLPTAYYLRALERIDPERARPVRVVSDDELAAEALEHRIEKCGYAITDHGPSSSDLDDLAVLAGSAGLVMSNSSFSWWAAAIGDVARGDDAHDVVGPHPWFASTQASPLLSRWQTAQVPA